MSGWHSCHFSSSLQTRRYSLSSIISPSFNARAWAWHERSWRLARGLWSAGSPATDLDWEIAQELNQWDEADCRWLEGVSQIRQGVWEANILQSLSFASVQHPGCEGLHQRWSPIIAVAAYPLTLHCQMWLFNCLSVQRSLCFITAHASPIMHFKAAIDCAVLTIHLTPFPLRMVNLLLFILGTAPHYR